MHRPRHAPRSAGIRPELLTVAIILVVAATGILSGAFDRPAVLAGAASSIRAASSVRASAHSGGSEPPHRAPRLVASARSFGRAHVLMPNVRLPRGPRGWSEVLRTNDLCPITAAWRRWGLVGTVRELVRAAWLFHGTGNGRLALADVSRRGGGYFPPHLSHRMGLDADIRPVRRDGRQCIRRTTWRSRTYDRKGTRELIRAIRAAAHGHLRLIFFDDPILIRAGLTRYWPGHDNHLHVSFCSPGIRRGPFACPAGTRRGGHGHHRKRHGKHNPGKRHRNRHHRNRHRRLKRHGRMFGLDSHVPRGFGYPFFR